MSIWIALLGIVIGYLLGAVSFTRILGRWVLPGDDLSAALYYAMQERLIRRFPLISPGWMNHPVPGKWTTPDVDQAAKNLIGLGARALVFAPVGFVTENHETQLDIGYTIDVVKDQVETVHLATLNDDAELLAMGAKWIHPLIDELRAG